MGEEPLQQGRLGRTTVKEGERILAPTRRPDGTMRKPIRIRAGYVPQDEVAIYQSKGALLKKGGAAEPVPGYDPPVEEERPKTKSEKRNKRKKEKKQQQVASSSSEPDKGKDSVLNVAETAGEVPPAEVSPHGSEPVESVVHQMNMLSMSTPPGGYSLDPSNGGSHSGGPLPSSNSAESADLGCSVPDLDKKIRALKKKIRLKEAQLTGDKQATNPDKSDIMAKLEGWHEEVKLLENRRAALVP
ncbi:hypothetical protein QJS04_geneDACA018650 [Acorus gramineus]|uniref:WIBG Mago-binding domain-containing protein n=1 Tax=Acorus gramineus TaxID=55184 RepID=A0AAV9AIN3_ACOGR|nr:hypothetical protein QJS04_geneDACA018650 [Acorus gramineus]